MGVGFVAYACQSSYVRIERSGNGENSDVTTYEVPFMACAVIGLDCIVLSTSVPRILEVEFVVVVFHGFINGTERNDVIAYAMLRLFFNENGPASLNRAI